jgi:transcriptional regulator with XRE-family HTH domain
MMGLDDSLRECIENHLQVSEETLTSLAGRAGLHPSSLSRFMNKSRSLRTPTFCKLCELLDLRLVAGDPAGAARAVERRDRERCHEAGKRARELGRRFTVELERLADEMESLAG